MYDIEKLLEECLYENFKYWFTKIDAKHYNAYSKEHGQNVGIVDCTNEKIEFLANDDCPGFNYDEYDIAVGDFYTFRENRPEFYAMQQIELDPIEKEADQYQMLLAGAMGVRFFRTGKNPDDGLKSAAQAISWLRSTDFFESPASTIYHDNYAGGLMNHCLKVVKYIQELRYAPVFSKVPEDSAILVALIHDWCKIGLYESYLKNVKDEKTGQWNQVTAYKHREETFMALGHGVSSMYLAIRFFPLTLEESVAIRWHMGEYNVAKNEMNELHQCNEKYPLVQLLQFADRLSITKYE